MHFMWIYSFFLTLALVFAVENVPSVQDSVTSTQKSHPKKTSAVHVNEQSKFSEELLVRPLPSGHVYSHFEFTTVWSNPSIRAAIEDYKDFDFPTYDLFPRALGEVIERYHVRELHLSLTQGLWRHHKWGYPVVDAPPGATLWAWFNPAPQEELDQTWRDLVNALSGLFCASLNFIDSTNTASPALSFRPAGLAEPWYAGNSSFLRYSALARENVCTENLTPWKKLLPCDTKAGLASILFPGPLYSAHYHSLGVHLRPACQDGGACHTPHLELVLSVSLVQHRLQDGRQDFTMRHLYSSPLFSSCPLADQSMLYIDVTGNEDLSQFSLSPAPDRISSSGPAGDDEAPSRRALAVYDLRQLLLSTKDAVNVAVRWARPHVYGFVPAPPLLATRYIAGYGQEGGSIRVVLTNTGSLNVSVVYLELLPWYLRLYLHPTHQASSVGYLSQLVTARDRERGWVYESVVTVPAGQTVELSLAFTRALLKWLEYPPDANHGFYLPAATLSFQLSQPRNVSVNARDTRTLLDKLQVSPGSSFVRLHTETLLVSLPTPDFSMPYNVICLACTVVALAFGPIHNITTKRLTLKKVESGNSVLSSLVAKLKRLLRIKAKETEATVASSSGGQEEVSDGQSPGIKDTAVGDRPEVSGSSAGEEESGSTSEPEVDAVDTRTQRQQPSLSQQQQDDKDEPPSKPQLGKRTRLRQER